MSDDYHLQPTKVDIPDELLHASTVDWQKANLPGPLGDTRGAADKAASPEFAETWPPSAAS